ncbi:MAG: cyclic nucleotide-gated ion channel [Parvibaculaceae bacterium]|nr:cyclic nucleotide-gated ion channel [Parvibaculaceae bacterium]HBM89110.1 cyclic nucleotide-binding protein [Rhodobiaceae bacterium]
MVLPEPLDRQPVGGANAHDGVSDVRRWLYILLEAGKTGDRPSAIFDVFMVGLILANVVAFAAETDVRIAAAYGEELRFFNAFSIAIFTVEYLIRLWVCVDHPAFRGQPRWRVRLGYSMAPQMLIDLIVILPFYLSFLFAVDLRVLRIFRLFRFLMLARYSPALYTIGRVFKSERRAMLAALIVMSGMLIFSATGIYWLEHEVQPEAFGSIPMSMWWALATLTTVGYGDVVPLTTLGRFFGGLVMIFGLGMFAMPIAIVSSGFAREIHRRDFVVSWGMVARVPLFQELKPALLADLVELLEAQVIDPDAAIAHKGDVADAMYFIVIGRVRLDFDERSVELGEGEYFGEMALLEDRRRSADIVTLSQAHVLKLDARNFREFIGRHPEARVRLLDAIRARDLTRGATDELEREIEEEKRDL